jgi:hypothetical protein
VDTPAVGLDRHTGDAHERCPDDGDAHEEVPGLWWRARDARERTVVQGNLLSWRWWEPLDWLCMLYLCG